MSPRKRILPLATAVAMAGAMVVAPAASAAPESLPDTTNVNGYRNVGYFGAWQATGETGATLKKLFVDGNAGDYLTHINYSFGNIAGAQSFIDEAIADGVQGLDGVQEYSCFISDTPAPPHELPNAPMTETAGDAQSDFLHMFDAADSVNGVADTPDQALAGNLNQLRQVKQLYPNLKVKVSLGGWSWSKSFSDAVATPERRTNLVNSCIDLWIKGNLPEIDVHDEDGNVIATFGGEGVAAGIVDGFDLDWEWPGAVDWTGEANTGEVGNSFDPENDKDNYREFARELREALDALGTETGKRYEISAFLPAGNGNIVAGGWNDPEFFQYLDFGNLQGYDLHGTWVGNTGHQGNVYGDPEVNWGLGLDTVIAAYVNNGIPASKLNLGLAAYGHGWVDTERDPWSPGAGLPGQPLTWDQIKQRDDLEIFHELYNGNFNATFAYSEENRDWWTFDDPVAVAEKTHWALCQGLGGVDFWELAQDVEIDLPRTAFEVLTDAPRGPLNGVNLSRTGSGDALDCSIYDVAPPVDEEEEDEDGTGDGDTGTGDGDTGTGDGDSGTGNGGTDAGDGDTGSGDTGTGDTGTGGSAGGSTDRHPDTGGVISYGAVALGVMLLGAGVLFVLRRRSAEEA